MKDRHGNEFVFVPANATEEMTVEMLASKDFDGIWTAAIAAAPKFEAPEVDDATADRVHRNYFLAPGVTSGAELGHQMISAVRSELGPALGLVELREPTPEECKKIERQWSRILDSVSETQEVRADTCGRAMFNAVAAYLRGGLK